MHTYMYTDIYLCIKYTKIDVDKHLWGSGNFYELGILLVGIFILRAVLFGVYIRAHTGP